MKKWIVAITATAALGMVLAGCDIYTPRWVEVSNDRIQFACAPESEVSDTSAAASRGGTVLEVIVTCKDGRTAVLHAADEDHGRPGFLVGGEPINQKAVKLALPTPTLPAG
jgi:hypothetical protein